jgi:hypothetical protein
MGLSVVSCTSVLPTSFPFQFKMQYGTLSFLASNIVTVIPSMVQRFAVQRRAKCEPRAAEDESRSLESVAK